MHAADMPFQCKHKLSGRLHLALLPSSSRSGTVTCCRRRPAVADKLLGKCVAILLRCVSGSMNPVALDVIAS